MPYTIEVLSDAFFELWRAQAEVRDVFGRAITLGGPISFAIVDGDHTHEAVRGDFANCAEFVEPGGYMLFDDTRRFGPFGARAAVLEALKDDRFRLVMECPNLLVQRVR